MSAVFDRITAPPILVMLVLYFLSVADSCFLTVVVLALLGKLPFTLTTSWSSLLCTCFSSLVDVNVTFWRITGIASFTVLLEVAIDILAVCCTLAATSSGRKLMASGEVGGLEAQDGGELNTPASLLHIDGVALYGGLL